MEKWIMLLVLLFLLSLSLVGAYTIEKENFFSSLLLQESLDEAECDRLQMQLAAADSSTTLDRVPQLLGKWVSQDCEVRPGPEFLLRNYFFSKTNSFRLLQHFYEDESCHLPSYSVVAKGSLILKSPSGVTLSGTLSKFTLVKVTIIPHTTEAAERLSSKSKHKCAERYRKAWKPHREYVVYSTGDHFSDILKPGRKYSKFRKRKSYKAVDCIEVMGLEFNELLLIRTQTRPTEYQKRKKELLLGDVHSFKESKFDYKPTSFQVPLLKSDTVFDCVNCLLISEGNERSPPYLLSKPNLPPLLHGQWVSQRCEVRPLGMFLTRSFSFDSRNRTWSGDHKFFADPFCAEPTFTVSTSGKYLLGSVITKEKIILKRKTGTNFDFKIEKASLTLFDHTLKNFFSAEKNCGTGSWLVGVAKDLSPTVGCSVLDIYLPSTDYELIKLEIDNKGTPLLFMGLPITGKKKRNFNERPTSYQAPLVQCSVFPRQNHVNYYLQPTSHARTAARSSSLRIPNFWCLLVGFLYIFCRF